MAQRLQYINEISQSSLHYEGKLWSFGKRESTAAEAEAGLAHITQEVLPAGQITQITVSVFPALLGDAVFYKQRSPDVMLECDTDKKGYAL